ncbi:barwin-like endoglucanase [Lindgomyces ingoldianus]|uniref:Barwin-like endoglucanase n=1 Tax=Lindgomyces ingoldianus TaxID=673940 RepID=A0ACB6QLL7_9PLEO|nr:barwin-like endoglucanase [Lindgomyces ingoldianus]KAF2467874.1 barwin-like endoglucanase [Lindgomyces ingoldianus]
MSDSNWNGASACGSCVRITGPWGNSITAMVVDQCPGCGPNHLDLFPDAFKALADPNTGEIQVSWDWVSCEISSPIVLRAKEGGSKYWFSMQVLNENVSVRSLDVSTDWGNTWEGTTRRPYNFFEKEDHGGFGADKVTVKITSWNGEEIVIWNVGVNGEEQTTAEGNFRKI